MRVCSAKWAQTPEPVPDGETLGPPVVPSRPEPWRDLNHKAHSGGKVPWDHQTSPTHPPAWILPSSLTCVKPSRLCTPDSAAVRMASLSECWNISHWNVSHQPALRQVRQALRSGSPRRLVGLAYGQTCLELRVSRGYETWRPLGCHLETHQVGKGALRGAEVDSVGRG